MKKLRLLSSVLALITGGTVIAQCLSIYYSFSGGQMYTAELIHNKLTVLLCPCLAWLASAIAAAVYELKATKKADICPKESISVSRKGRIIAAVAGALAAIWLLVYLCTPAHFESRELEQTVGEMLKTLIPAAVVIIVSAFFLQWDISPRPAMNKPQNLKWVRSALLVLAAILIVVGIINGGMRDVLVKAINICSECIGLG